MPFGRALVKIGEHRFPARVIAATRDGLAADAKLQKPPIAEAEARVAASGQVSEDDERILSKDRQVNARLRTTCSDDAQLRGSPQDNVLPTSVEATVNCRILPDETREQTLATLKSVVGDPSVEITAADDSPGTGRTRPPKGRSPPRSARWRRRCGRGVPIVPWMSTGVDRLAPPARHRDPRVWRRRLGYLPRRRALRPYGARP